MFLILDCSQSKIWILIIVFIKFAPALQECYSTLFWNPTSTVIFSHAPTEHISVKFESSKEICEKNLAIFLTLEMIIKTLIVSQFTGDPLEISTSQQSFSKSTAVIKSSFSSSSSWLR